MKMKKIILLALFFNTTCQFDAQTFIGGDVHSLAICNDNTVKAWGNNTLGELGNGTTVDSHVPVSVNSLTGIVAVAGGGYFSMALKSDHTLWAWGNNAEGELGNGNNTNSSVPVQVTNWTTGYIAIDAGYDYSLAIKPDGSVWSWGKNTHGQLGNGNNTNSNVPVHVMLSL